MNHAELGSSRLVVVWIKTKASVMKKLLNKHKLTMGTKLPEMKKSFDPEAIKAGDISLLESVIDLSPSCITETIGPDARTALHIAAHFGQVEVCKLLLSYVEVAKDVDKMRDKCGNTALHAGAGSEHEDAVDCMQLLLAKGADVEARNNEGLSPLHVAALERRKENIKYLISRNSQMNSKDKHGNSVVQTIAKKVPQSMEEFKKHLDGGIVLEKDGLNREASINLDFNKLLDRNKLDKESYDIILFQELVNSPFKEFIEHPLSQSFLHLKFSQVKWFFITFILTPHFVFSVVYSIYCGLMFGLLCAPGEDLSAKDRKHPMDKITCKCFNATDVVAAANNTDVNSTAINNTVLNIKIAFTAWLFLALCVALYILREMFKLSSNWKGYFLQIGAYRNVFNIASTILIIKNGSPLSLINQVSQEPNISLFRWQFHVASFSCLLLWVEMMILVGKLPRFGKHVQMFRSVALKMLEFSVAYVCIAIGFMMAFMILFSSDEPFNQFPGSLVAILVMMLGEIEYKDLYYQPKQKIQFNNSLVNLTRGSSFGDILNFTDGSGIATIKDESEYQQFPGTAQLMVVLFIVIVSIVIMNLLVGLAVSDINVLLKMGKRDQLIAQVELIYYFEKFRDQVELINSYKSNKLKIPFLSKFVTKSLDNFDMSVTIRYSDIMDKTLPEGLKKTLYDHCLWKDQEARKLIQNKELSDIKTQLDEVKSLLMQMKLSQTESDSPSVMYNTRL